MNSNLQILDYKRQRALDWLRQTVEKNPTQFLKFDPELDALVRKVAGLQEGNLYGFVTVPDAIRRSDLPANQIRAKRETWVKLKPIASNYLKETEKIRVAAGHVVTFADLVNDKHQHLHLTVDKANKSIQSQGFIYGPHWELPDKIRDREVKLQVPYASQRDNWERYHGPGGRQCCLTAHCMAANYLLGGAITKEAKAKGYQEAEDLYGQVLYEFGDTTNPQAHTPTLAEFDIESYFTYTASIKDLILCLDHGVPVPMGVAYKASGHYVCAVGHNAEGVYIHDPFGIRIGQTDNYENSPGDFDFVTWNWLQAKWVDQGSEAGWMRVVTKVKENGTGLPNDL